jgi:peroxiredoxin
MLRSAGALLVFWLCAVPAAMSQAQSALEAAQALDKEILQLKKLPDAAQAAAIRDLAIRIRTQPMNAGDRVALAFNLTNEADLENGRDTLQEVVKTLATALRDAPGRDKDDSNYLRLAEIVRYEHMQVSLDDSRYADAVARLESEDRRRAGADFTLGDLEGRTWNLKSLRGKVVLINFWATWCPPCVKELPGLQAVYERFKDQGLVILGISNEAAPALRSFVAERKIGYPVLSDPGKKVGDLFLIPGIGIPESFLYDREGRLVDQTIDTPTMQRFLEMLGRTGIH